LFAIRCVDDSEMSRLHAAYLNDPSPTDIMTFPYDPEDEEQGGDILLSVDSAATNARDHGWSTDDELRFLILHGLLHILGWDDHDPGARNEMLDRQHALLAGWQGANT
jgi:probable rRNA maturation factor